MLFCVNSKEQCIQQSSKKTSSSQITTLLLLLFFVVGLLVTHLWLLCFPTLPCMDPQMIWVSDMRQWVFDECNNAKVLHHLPLLCWIIGAFLYVDPHKWCDSVMFKNFWIEYYNVQVLYCLPFLSWIVGIWFVLEISIEMENNFLMQTKRYFCRFSKFDWTLKLRFMCSISPGL